MTIVTPPLPFQFPSHQERLGKGLPAPIAMQWKEASHFFFFHNAMTDHQLIRLYLQAQNIRRLENIATAFDIEAVDLVSEKRKQEGAVLSLGDKDIVIEAILGSITR